MSKISFQDFPRASAKEKEAAIRAAYADGYQSGLNWPDKWESRGKPGGPWVYSDGKHPAFSEQSRRENEAWKAGWDAGHFEKHARRADLAKGWDDRGGIGEGGLR